MVLEKHEYSIDCTATSVLRVAEKTTPLDCEKLRRAVLHGEQLQSPVSTKVLSTLNLKEATCKTLEEGFKWKIWRQF